MIRECTCLFCCLLLSFFQAQAQLTKATAEKILNDLYISTGNFQAPKPSIVISSKEKHIAAYNPIRNQILLEEKAMAVCESFGRDAANALAFLLGHELTHSYQQVGWATSYLAYDEEKDSDTELERMADIQGAFATRLAGYDAEKLIPSLIEQLYEAYEIEEELEGYPSMAERQATANYVTAKTDSLWHVFQSASYLTALQEYELATESYLYLLRFYSGKEVYNNLGLLYAKNAMVFSGKNQDPYLYPFELDGDSRLADTRSDDLSAEEFEIRTYYLSQSDQYFSKAQKLDPNYIQAYINQLCVKVMSGNSEEVIQQFRRGEIEVNLRRKKADDQQIASVRLAVAIAFSLEGEENPPYIDAADKLLTELIKSPFSHIQRFARHNLDQLRNDPEKQTRSGRCFLPASPAMIIDKLYSPSKYLRKEGMFLDDNLDAELFWEPLDHSTVYIAKWQGDVKVFQRVHDEGAVAPGNVQIGYRAQVLLQQLEGQDHSILSTSNGYFIHVPDCQVIFYINTKERIQEWVKYF